MDEREQAELIRLREIVATVHKHAVAANLWQVRGIIESAWPGGHTCQECQVFENWVERTFTKTA